MPKKTEKPKGQAVNLPKNIQQMGRTNGGVKIYLEDYSGTWLRRILTEETIRHGILLGKKQISDNQTYFFVKAILAVKAEPKEQYWKYDWNEIYELMQKYFMEDGQEPLEVLGWAMPIEDYKKLDINELEHMHRANFEGNMTLAFTINMQDGREQFYILENNKFHSLSGYYIYYEKNKAMQNYVLENQPGPCVETEEVVKGNRESYRAMLQNRKEMVQKRYTVSVLYAASTFLVMIVIVLGITMMNNYEKMKNMQAALNDLSKSVINGEVQAENVVSTQTVTPVSPDNQQVVEQQTTANQQTITEQPTTAGYSTVIEQQAIATQSVVASQQNNTNQQSTDNPDETVQAMSSAIVQSGDSEESRQNQTVRKRYTIKPGDTLAAISIKLYNTDQMVDKICEYNHIENGDQIVAGDVLILP